MSALSLEGLGEYAEDPQDLHQFLLRSSTLARRTAGRHQRSGFELLERELDRLLSAAGQACPEDPAAHGFDVEQSSCPATLDLAVRFIETHAAEPIELADIAAAAGLSPRALQVSFRQYRGITPMGYLRRVRLELAHRNLLAARCGDGQTVTDIAGRCGFGQLSRFARAYQDRYGEHPRRTLADTAP